MIDSFREFIELASSRSFAKTADYLHVTQSTLSRHITDLERKLGFKLFERNPLKLTDAGAFCLQAITPVVNAFDKAIAESRAFAEQSAIQLRIHLLPSSNEYAEAVYTALAQLRQAHPNLSVKVMLDSSVDAYSSVVLGITDAAFLANYPEEPITDGFLCETFGGCNVEFWAHRKSGLFEKQPIFPEDIEGYALVASTNKAFSVWFDMQVSIMKRLGLTPPVHIRELNTLNEFALTIQPDEIMVTPANTNDPSSLINPDHRCLEWGGPQLRSDYCVLYGEGPKAPLIRELAHYCEKIFSEGALGKQSLGS